MELPTDTIETPLGAMLAVFADQRLVLLDFADDQARIRANLERRFGKDAVMRKRRDEDFRARLGAYFGGRADAFDGLAIDPGGTPFQRLVWAELLRIPFGQTRSYADIAKAVGRPGAARAVGTANGANPIAIAVPCHRVIGTGGRLAGYAGGVRRKRKLLDHESGG